MITIASLWLPILLSSVLVFVASSIIHMASPWHKTDYPRLPDQDKVLDALRPFAIPPGDYFMPRARDMKDMKTPEFALKMKQGPVFVMTMMPNGVMSMARNLGIWFAYIVVLGIFGAYVASGEFPPGTPSLKVFALVGTTVFLGYSAALWQMSIWYYRSWSITIKSTLDGLIYALLTAGTFAWLWPR